MNTEIPLPKERKREIMEKGVDNQNGMVDFAHLNYMYLCCFILLEN